MNRWLSFPQPIRPSSAWHRAEKRGQAKIHRPVPGTNAATQGKHSLWLIIFFSLWLTACQQASEPSSLNGAETIPVTLVAAALPPNPVCRSGFVTHDLDHITATPGEAVHQFATNGAGVAINDLNGDGWLDIVLANLHGPASVLWNQGGLVFRTERLPDQNSQAVNIVDVEGDGLLDIVFTHVTSSLSYWRNNGPVAPGQAVLERDVLPHVLEMAHAMAWGDLNGDGDLDLVTGSYDAELNQVLGNSFLFSDGAGVYYYDRQGDDFVAQRLAAASQTLVIALFDANGDNQADILVGNDFDLGDMAWVKASGSWFAAAPFATTSQHTMNYGWADIDNNGSLELFSTDMAPYDISVETMAQWLPMMATMTHRLPKGDPQIAQNVLQVRGRTGSYHNEAERRGISATGWSWSGKFGDLDQDGWVDLYVVNGMIDAELFAYLPGSELVEENQGFRNQGNGNFAAMPAWGLGSTGSGRGLSLADLDNDGDLDMVVNNLRSPAQLLENQLCEGTGLTVQLRWRGSRNPFALGARLMLQTDSTTMYRDVRASSGYLSGDPVQVHFGLPTGATIRQLYILWPDGQRSTLSGLTPQTGLTITR